MNYWWTSDYHFSHFNIIRYCKRLFETAEDADPNVPWNFCGHVHEKYRVKRLNENSLVVNLCVEVWNYYPVTFEEISSAVSAFLKEDKKSGAPDQI